MKLLLLSLAAVFPVLSQQTQITLDTKSTVVNFTLGDVLHTVHGAFRLTKGDLWFDPASTKAGGQIVVAAASGDSGGHARDARMSKSILQADLFPVITFTPDHIQGKINLAGHSEFRLQGLFSIHGMPHKLAMNVKVRLRRIG